jgi:hypothetical protein
MRPEKIKVVRIVMKMNIEGKKEEENQKRDGWI